MPLGWMGGSSTHVNEKFEEEHGRSYIGSRDIDIGIHVDSEMDAEGLPEDTVAKTLSEIEELGYTKSRFGSVQNFLRDTGEPLTEEEAESQHMHEVFQVYINVIPDTDELDEFKEAFGFRPPAEPLLKPVFQEDSSELLGNYVSWEVDDAVIVSPELLAAMKIRSLPDRDKSHKQVKDVADLHALLWYTKEYSEMTTETLTWVSDEDIERLEKVFNTELAEEAANLLQTHSSTLEESINRLLRQ